MTKPDSVNMPNLPARHVRKDYSGFLMLFAFFALAAYAGAFNPENWKNLAEQFSFNFIKDGRYTWLITGLRNTFAMTLIAGALGIVIGLTLSIIRVAYKSGAPIKALDQLANFYITVIRGTPVMIQIMIIYYGIFASVEVNKVLTAGIAFGINSGAYVAENFRAGIESIDKGQMEAGRSLGLSYGKTMRLIVLPQAIKNILPTLFNELIVLLKETSVAGYIGLTDLTRAGQNIKDITYDPYMPYLLVAIVYLIIVLGLSHLLRLLERRLARSDRH